MTTSAIYEPGEKTHRDENFPVASYLIAGKYRPTILAFYRFARASDDVADHPHLQEKEKILLLDQFEATLLGKSDAIADALPLREALATHGLSPRHALDLLIAFKQDASKQRYRNWDELIQYCMFSAAPVGRFVLDVHGENKSTWTASDNLCVALQIINHLQDCKADYERLNRIYIPEETFARYGAAEHMLGSAQAPQPLRECITDLARKTEFLLGASLSTQVQDKRLRLEVTVIEKVAKRLLKMLLARDPLSERVHLTPLQFTSLTASSVLEMLTTKAKVAA